MNKPPVILLIEDHQDLGEIFKQRLEYENIEVLWAQSAGVASELIKQNPVLVVSDINLNAHQNGLELCKELRKKGHTQPFMFITGATSLDYDQQAQAIGAIDFMYKPFGLAELTEVIKKRLNEITSTTAAI